MESSSVNATSPAARYNPTNFASQLGFGTLFSHIINLVRQCIFMAATLGSIFAFCVGVFLLLNQDVVYLCFSVCIENATVVGVDDLLSNTTESLASLHARQTLFFPMKAPTLLIQRIHVTRSACGFGPMFRTFVAGHYLYDMWSTSIDLAGKKLLFGNQAEHRVSIHGWYYVPFKLVSAVAFFLSPWLVPRMYDHCNFVSLREAVRFKHE